MNFRGVLQCFDTFLIRSWFVFGPFLVLFDPFFVLFFILFDHFLIFFGPFLIFLIILGLVDVDSNFDDHADSQNRLGFLHGPC